MGVHGEGVHAANIGVRYEAYFQAIFPMSFRWTQIKVKPPDGRHIARATWRRHIRTRTGWQDVAGDVAGDVAR